MFSYCIGKNLKCGNIMRQLGREFPASETKELGTYLDVPHAKIQEFRENNMVNAKGMLIDVLNYWLETDPEEQVSRGCGGLWLWSFGREDKTEELTMS